MEYKVKYKLNGTVGVLLYKLFLIIICKCGILSIL